MHIHPRRLPLARGPRNDGIRLGIWLVYTDRRQTDDRQTTDTHIEKKMDTRFLLSISSPPRSFPSNHLLGMYRKRSFPSYSQS